MRKALLLTAVLPFVISAETTPIVIGTIGQTVDASRYVPQLKQDSIATSNINTQGLINKRFIVHSKLLTPGIVAKRSVGIPLLLTPIYLVGTDEKSINWVNTFKDRLKHLKATGLLVDVKGYKDYQNFVSKTGLHLSPLSGDGLAKQYSIKHFPVLISKNLIEQ